VLANGPLFSQHALLSHTTAHTHNHTVTAKHTSTSPPILTWRLAPSASLAARVRRTACVLLQGMFSTVTPTPSVSQSYRVWSAIEWRAWWIHARLSNRPRQCRRNIITTLNHVLVAGSRSSEGAQSMVRTCTHRCIQPMQ
jgi:hypothetical protein